MQENVTPITVKKESLVIDGNSLVINSLKIVNPELVEFLATKANIEEAFIDLLNAALFVRRLSEVSIETEALNSVADKVKTSVEKAGDDAVNDFAALIKTHCDIENPIGLARLLRDQVVPAIVHELNPMNKKSPMYKIYDPLIDLVQRVSADEGAKEAVDNSSTKGKNFNSTMDGILQKLASANGDEIEFVNDVKSATGLKGGDEIVTLPPEMTGGHSVKIVWEFKAERDLTQPKILKELAGAIVNRQAKSGVFVLAREPEYEHWASHSFHSGNRLIILVDKDEPDTYLIQFAYLWSRMNAMKDLTTNASSLDLEKLQYLFDQAEVTLKDFRNIKTAHTGIETSLGDARRWVGNIENALKAQFAEISSTLKGDDEFDQIVSQINKKKKA